MTGTRPEETPGAVVFARPPGARGVLGIALILGAGAALMALGPTLTAQAAALAERLEFASPRLVEATATTTCKFAVAFAFFLALAWGSRRFAHTVVTPDHVVVRPLWIPWAVVVPLSDVVARRVTAHGIQLEAPRTVEGLVAWLLILLIPCDPGRTASVHALLDERSAPAQDAGVTAGRPMDVRDIAGSVLVAGTLAALGALATPVVGPAAATAYWITAVLGATLAYLVLAQGRTVVHLGSETFSILSRCVPWTDVERFAALDGWVAAELRGGVRRCVRIDGDLAPLLAAARQRLGALGRADAVTDALPPWVRRGRRLAVATIVACAALALTSGPGYALVRQGSVLVTDHRGQAVLWVHRLRDGRPALVVIAEAGLRLRATTGGPFDVVVDEGGGEPVAEVDVARGRALVAGREHAMPAGTTLVHVRRDGVSASTRPLPADLPRVVVTIQQVAGDAQHARWSQDGLPLLAGWLGPESDLAARDALAGRTSTRCLVAREVGGAVLGVRVERGAVAAAAIVESSVILVGCAACAGEPGALTVVGGRGRSRTVPLPTLEEARAALAGLAAGQPLGQAAVGPAFDEALGR